MEKLTLEQRKELLSKGNELQLAIEGRYTNLRIYTGYNGNGKHPANTVYIRLDRANQYSAPLSVESYTYLEKESKEVKELLRFGFSSPLSDLDEILNIVSDMKERQCILW